MQGTLYGGRLDLTSNSLQVIDITKSAKELTFDRLDCPALREIRCRDFRFYSNGLIPVPPPVGDEQIDSHWRREWKRDDLSEEMLSLPCTFANIVDFEPGSLFELPEQCAVIWDDVDGEAERRGTYSARFAEEERGTSGAPRAGCIWATSTTTVAELMSRIGTRGGSKVR